MINLGKCIGVLGGQKIFKEVCPTVVKAFKTNSKGIAKLAGYDSHVIQRTTLRFVDASGNVTRTVSRSGITKSDLLSKGVKKDYSQLSSQWNLYKPMRNTEYKFADRCVSKMDRFTNGSTSYRQINLSPDGKSVVYTRSQDVLAPDMLGRQVYNDVTKEYGFCGSNLIRSDRSGNPYKIFELNEKPPIWTSLADFVK